MKRTARLMHKKSIVLLLPLALCSCQREESYPSRPITLVCPWAAGGGTDRVSRQIAVGLERELKVPVNVVNATGGGGVTGHTRGALARADGYTLTMITPELTMLHWRGLTSITFREFDPLLSVNGDHAAIFVRADSEWQTIDDLARTIKASESPVKASGSAFGSIWHVALAGWLTSMGLAPNDVIWVSINGSSPSLQQLLAQTVDVVCCSVPEARTLLDAGKVRCLAIMADEPQADMPGTPTLRDRNWDWSLTGWRGLALPLGVPEDRKAKLLDALRRVVHGEEYRTFLHKAGFGHRAEEPGEFATTLETSDTRFGEIMTSDAFRSIQRQRFGPMFFPVISASLLAVVLAAALWTGTLRRREDAPPLTRPGLLKIGAVLAALAFYVLAAEWLGFLLTAAVMTCALMLCFGARARTVVLVTACLVPAVYQLFAVGLRVPLPVGLLGW
jgi:tripartite-type tricarboxylate transporter receptor subunit TctC